MLRRRPRTLSARELFVGQLSETFAAPPRLQRRWRPSTSIWSYLWVLGLVPPLALLYFQLRGN